MLLYVRLVRTLIMLLPFPSFLEISISRETGDLMASWDGLDPIWVSPRMVSRIWPICLVRDTFWRLAQLAQIRVANYLKVPIPQAPVALFLMLVRHNYGQIEAILD